MATDNRNDSDAGTPGAVKTIPIRDFHAHVWKDAARDVFHWRITRNGQRISEGISLNEPGAWALATTAAKKPWDVDISPMPDDDYPGCDPRVLRSMRNVIRASEAIDSIASILTRNYFELDSVDDDARPLRENTTLGLMRGLEALSDYLSKTAEEVASQQSRRARH